MELHISSLHKVERSVTLPEIILVKGMLNIQMVINIMEITLTVSDKEKESTFMPMEIVTKAISKTILNTELANSLIRIKANTMVKM